MILVCVKMYKRNLNMDLMLFIGCMFFVCNKWDLIKDEECE